MKKIAILQSNYIPWKGYFDLINSVDEFVLYDDMQYTRRDWRNRNKIKTSQGSKWLTVPVDVKGKYFQKINETRISEPDWAVKHWQTIKQFYTKTSYFKKYKDSFEDFYLNNNEELLSQVNLRLIKIINEILGINTKLRWSSEFNLVEGKTEKLLGICQQASADVYLSGPAAKDYLDVALAAKMGIQVEWMDYSGYLDYQQLHSPFEHGVTILDLIFNEGPNAKNFMKSFK
ncbi:WbqC family protein [Alphaproteobacteria bacterium LSUCC0684]